LRVAIAGCGPKGLYALERLLGHAAELPATALRMEVDVFEPHPAAGAGANYDPAQPEYLRMNFAADQLDMWWPGGGVVPAAERRSFEAWRAKLGGGVDEYPPRAEVGRYLSEGLAAVLRHAPAKVDVQMHRAAVDELTPAGRQWLVESAGSARAYDEVLICTGHQSPAPTARPESVPAGGVVAIRGFALTFIDAALALTEGRGGRFEATDHAYRLKYLPGPAEPAAILPFSRTGRPLLAKPGRAIEARVPALRRIAAEGRARIACLEGVVDLHGDLLPILIATTCAALAAASGRDDHERLRVQIGRRFAEAAGGVQEAGEPEPAEAIAESLAVGNGSALPGVPWALGHTWRALYPALVSRLGGDGLAARDWPAFLRLSAEMERVAFGPPPLNAAKLLALIEAGRVDLAHVRGGRLVGEEGHLSLRSEHGEQPVDAVLDAVLPAPGALGHPGLLARLISAGHVRIAPGRRGLEVTADAACRGAAPGLSAIGRPTEDSVIGNDTLSRALHPHADRWARRVAQRCHDDSIAAARRRLWTPA
jgi:diaminopimelate decarboxylase